MLELWRLIAIFESSAVFQKNRNDVHLKLKVEHHLLFTVWAYVCVEGEIRGSTSAFKYGSKAERIRASTIVEFVYYWEGAGLHLGRAGLSLFNKYGCADVNIVIAEQVRAPCNRRSFVKTELS
jgi:hypothetical protein